MIRLVTDEWMTREWGEWLHEPHLFMWPNFYKRMQRMLHAEKTSMKKSEGNDGGLHLERERLMLSRKREN